MLTKSWISLLSLTRFKLLVWDGIDDIELWFSTYLLYLRSKTLDQAKSTPCGCRRVLRQEPPNFFYFSLLFSLFSFVSDKLYLFYVSSNFVGYFQSILVWFHSFLQRDVLLCGECNTCIQRFWETLLPNPFDALYWNYLYKH